MDPERLRALRLTKLRALVSQHGEAEPDGADTLGDDVAVMAGPTAWVLISEKPDFRLGAALYWAASRGAQALRFLSDEEASVAARRIRGFRLEGSVWRVVQRDLVPVEPAPLPPEAPPPTAPDLEELLRSAGLEVVYEHGMVLGEINGLEVARVLHGLDGTPVLEVGVGRFDREAALIMHGDRPPADALAATIEQVRPHRQRGAMPHPVNRLARERWLRNQLVRDPSPLGLIELVPVSPAEPRANLREPSPAPALGRDEEGRRVLVVCSVGVDLEVLPAAADLVDRERPDRVVVAVPPRDLLPPLRQVASLLVPEAELVAVDGEWP